MRFLRCLLQYRKILSFLSKDHRHPIISPNPILFSFRRRSFSTYTWGFAEDGRLGLGDDLDQDLNMHVVMVSKPRLVFGLEGLKIQKVACGDSFTLFLSESGNLYSCGSGFYGQTGLLGQDNSFQPQLIESINDPVVDVAAGNRHSLVLTDNGKVYSFGNATYGQLGHEGTEQVVSQPKWIESLTHDEIKVKSVHAGSDYSMILCENGAVYSFGRGDFGRLGHGSHDKVLRPQKIRTLNSVKIQSIFCGPYNTFAIDDEDNVFSWGGGSYGTLGTGDDNHILEPVQIESLSGLELIKICPGWNHALALTKKGQVIFWGEPEYIFMTEHVAPRANTIGGAPFKLNYNFTQGAPAGTHVCDIGVGFSHSMVATSAGQVLAWGRGTNGILGQGHLYDMSEPTVVYVDDEDITDPVPLLVQNLQGPRLLESTRIYCGHSHAVAVNDDLE